MPPMSASEHLLSRIRAHIPAGYWRVLSVYRVAHGGATSAAVRRPVCSLPMVVTGSLALGMDGGGHRHAGPPHAPATRGLVLPRSRLAVGSTRDAHLVRRAAARRADRRAGGWALALLARTKVRSPARPRARHPAPCPAPRSPCPRAPLSALARRSRYSPCPPVPLAGARRLRPQAPRMRGRGAGAARARASQAGWCFCGDLAACEAAAAAESPAAAAVVAAAVAAATAIVAALAIAPAACPRAAIDARAAVASLAPAGARPVSAPPQPPQPSYSDGRPSPQPSPPLLPPPRQRSSPPSPTLPSVGACRRASWAPFRPSSENLGTFWESSHICDEV